jgi:hypothetical protein
VRPIAQALGGPENCKNPAHKRPQAAQRAPASAKRTHKCKSLAWACGRGRESVWGVRRGLAHVAWARAPCSGAAPPRPQLGFSARHCT